MNFSIVFILLSILITSLNANNNCSTSYEVLHKSNGKYEIHVLDEIVDENIDLSLEAKMLLFQHFRTKNKNKKMKGLNLINFMEIKNWECGNFYHALFSIDEKDIEIAFDDQNSNSHFDYKRGKRLIFDKIVKIEFKEELTLEDYQKLYNLYFSLGKIQKTNEIMDKIIQIKGEIYD